MRIAPPEAPCSGYNFGKGVYFADLAGKSCHYSRPGLSDGIGLFVACEVALGKTQEFLSPSYNAATLPPGVHSTHALGHQHPDPKDSIMIDNDVEVPMGKTIDFSSNGMGANEFIVYNTN